LEIFILKNYIKMNEDFVFFFYFKKKKYFISGLNWIGKNKKSFAFSCVDFHDYIYLQKLQTKKNKHVHLRTNHPFPRCRYFGFAELLDFA
jgi:hypothetical protein